MTIRTRTDSLLLAGFCGFLFFYGLGQFGLIGADEPRYAQVAHEMLERRDWVTPTLGGQAWLEKPPLYYWQAILAYRIFGVSDASARLPSAVNATLLVLAVYFFLRRFRPGFELDAALITASSAGIIGHARAASMDMALAAAFCAGMIGWFAWHESGEKKYLTIFYASMAFGALAKGPVAPFLAALVIVSYVIVIREISLLRKTLWLPGIILFCAIALPWFVAVQMRNPEFFREFILQHNLGRFSQNLYHHTEPVWYYLPVAAIAFVPWTVFVIAALARLVGGWWTRRKVGARKDESQKNKSNGDDSAGRVDIFACCWLTAPLLFFSFSQSKLPGYILPALPAGGLLLAEYLRRKLQSGDETPLAKPVLVLHALLAAAGIVPALLIAYLITQHSLPGGRPMFIALAVAFMLCAGIALTLARRRGLRMLRFVTLIPVVLIVGAVLKLGAPAIDETLSARPIAKEIATVQTRPLPLAVYHVRRELEYGLTFYRNRLTFNYDWGRVPEEEHLLVAPENLQDEIRQRLPGRRVSYLGNYPAQRINYYWVAASR